MRSQCRRLQALRCPKRGFFGGPCFDRRGVSTLDYVLVLTVMFVISGVMFGFTRRLLVLVHEMWNLLISWPFM